MDKAGGTRRCICKKEWSNFIFQYYHTLDSYLHCLEWYSFKAAFQRCLILFKSYIVYHCMDILYLISLSCLVFNLHLMGLLWKVVVAAIFKNLFHWSIFDLQCCVNFCCTAKWLNCTHVSISFHILFQYGLLNIVPCAIQ